MVQQVKFLLMMVQVFFIGMSLVVVDFSPMYFLSTTSLLVMRQT